MPERPIARSRARPVTAPGRWLLAVLVATLAVAPPAAAQDSHAPPGALPHWLPSERWVYQHWLPYDEARLYAVLGADRGAIWRHLRDDARHTLAQLARRRGLTARQAAVRLVAPRRGRTRDVPFAELVARAERTLTQPHLSQHILFHSLHQLAIPDRARWIFGTASVAEFLRLRRAELSPQRIGRLHGRTQAQMLARSNAALRAEARKGVRSGAFTARQARLLLDRQLRQVPRFLGQSRYNGPPRTGSGARPVLPPNDFANGPSITADGATVVFDAYRAKIPEARTLGEIRVMRYDVASGERSDVSHDANPDAPRSAYNAEVAAGGGAVVFEQAEGNRTFGKRYGSMQVLARPLDGGPAVSLSHAGVARPRTAYAPTVSADGRLVAFGATDDGGRAGRSTNALEVRDRVDGTVRRIGGAGGGAVYEPRLSGDGRSVAYTAAEDRSAVYVHDLETSRSLLVARNAREPALSHDGSTVAYTTGTGGRSVLEVRDRGRRERLTRIGDGQALDPALSPDGRYVAFALRRGGRSSVWLLDRSTGARTAVAAAGHEPVLSADGTRVAYTTGAPLAGKPAGVPGVVLADLAAGTRTLLSTHAPAGRRARGARAASFVCDLPGRSSARRDRSPGPQPGGRRGREDAR